MGSDVVVIGFGAIGAAVAWRCAQRGLSVTAVDPDPGRAALHTAAGMLAPISELHYTEEPLLVLSLESVHGYPEFAAELEQVSGLPTGFEPCGTVSIAWDGADLAALRDLHAFGESLGIEAHLLTGRELHEVEPELAPGLPGGLLAAGDHQVDPRLMHAALCRAAVDAGVTVSDEAPVVKVHDGRVVGIEGVAAEHVVLAAGAWSAEVAGLPEDGRPPVRPVRGSTLRVRLTGPRRLRHVVRGNVKGNPIYLVPRASGEVVIGATAEERGFDLTHRAGGVYELLRDAQSVFPEIAEAELREINTGLRPGSPDNAPLIGESGVPGLIHATGHYRNGILLTPVTANAVADLVADGKAPDVIAPFSPQRFGSRG
jgi:glycine oxidase